jgi:zinc transport system substrate-binding protein
VLALLLTATVLSGCVNPYKQTDSDKISVVCTIFPQYDFTRQIAGGDVALTMLLKPGGEVHTYEPTPKDIIAIQSCHLFIYVGGQSDAWVEEILSSMDHPIKTIKLMDCVDTVEEEIVEGMEHEHEDETGDTEHEHEEEAELDEHVWTSPANAKLIVAKIRDALCDIYPADAAAYQKNADEYLAELQKLDDDIRDAVDNAARSEIVVGDRFPLRYFCDEFGLTYYAAFPGCATDTQASAATIAFLIDKVKQDNIPVVFHMELSNEQICNAICEATGAKSAMLSAVHNISKSDFEAGVTYIDLMEHNLKVLKEALN